MSSCATACRHMPCHVCCCRGALDAGCTREELMPLVEGIAAIAVGALPLLLHTA